jgi:hypothetical protein
VQPLENNPNTARKPGHKKKVIFIVAGIFLAALGLIALVGGAAIMYLNTGTDSEGYSLSPSYSIRTSSNAFVLWVAPLQVSDAFSWLGYDNIAATKWVVTTSDPKQEIFVGWAKASDIDPYLKGFSYESPDFFWSWRTTPYSPKIDIPSTSISRAGSPARPPSEESFWTTKATTANTTSIYWNPNWNIKEGMNIIAVMNADASSKVTANIQLGSKVPIFTWLPYLLIPLGITFLVLGLLLFKKRKSS